MAFKSNNHCSQCHMVNMTECGPSGWISQVVFSSGNGLPWTCRKCFHVQMLEHNILVLADLAKEGAKRKKIVRELMTIVDAMLLSKEKKWFDE